MISNHKSKDLCGRLCGVEEMVKIHWHSVCEDSVSTADLIKL